MIDCTRTTVEKHSKAFDNLKSQVEDLNSDANASITKITEQNEEMSKMFSESEIEQRKQSTKLAIYEEDSEDEEVGGSGKNESGEMQGGIQMGNEKVVETSL